ncbi:MAG: BatD family protein [Acidobacteriota bacterium]
MSRALQAKTLALVGLCLAASLAASAASAQSVSATVNRVETSLQEPLILSVTVSGSRTSRPSLPELPAFEARETGAAQNFQISNGRSTVSVTYSYLLIPRAAGTFTIGPVSAEIGGRTYRSRPFQVRVREADQPASGGEDLFIQIAVSEREPFVGEQVIYTWRFFHRIRIGNPQLVPPEFDGFQVEDLGEVREYETVRNGQRYRVYEWRKAIFPLRAGELTVSGSRLNCQVVVQNRGRRSPFDDFFGRGRAEPRSVAGPPITLNVRPLPAAPAAFSGLVGEFSLDAEASKRALQTGESTTLKITVAGQGNVQRIGEPDFPDLSAFKIYDDKPLRKISRNGVRLNGSRTFSKALVPLTAGSLEIPALSLVYFDPEAGTYRTARSEAITLDVTPADGKEELRLTESVAPTTGKVAVRILADDILPLKRDLAAVAASRPSPAGPIGWSGALAAPPLLFLGLWLARRRDQRYRRDGGLRRRQEALKRARRRLENLDEGNDGAIEASATLRAYIGDKLTLEGGALTAQEAEEALRGSGIDAELARQVHALLDRLDAARYARREAETTDLESTTLDLVRRLEGALRAARRATP